MKIDDNIEKFIEVSRKTIGKENLISIVLFGSRIRGDCNEWSDYDFLLITREKIPERVELKILNEIDFPANTIARTPFEMRKAIEILSSLEIYAIFEGRVVYGKSVDKFERQIKEVIRLSGIKMKPELGKGVIEFGA